jgi:diguanylate cyclase (GGDEF)-like protein
MEVRLQEEMMRASREKSEVAYLSVRIYGLEDFAEQFGTLHRDELTRNLGIAIKNNVRRCDIVGRVSDWDFALILPHTGNQADVVARRLSGMLNDFEKEHLKEYKGSGYSLSIGFSVYPSDACNAKDIMEIANNSSFHDDMRSLSQVDELQWEEAAVA